VSDTTEFVRVQTADENEGEPFVATVVSRDGDTITVEGVHTGDRFTVQTADTEPWPDMWL